MSLTQQQQWGLAYLVQKHNEGIVERNKNIAERNRLMPRDQPLIEEEVELTVETYLERETARIADSGYQQLMAEKERLTKEAFAKASEEQQTELLTMLGVPDILKG